MTPHAAVDYPSLVCRHAHAHKSERERKQTDIYHDHLSISAGRFHGK